MQNGGNRAQPHPTQESGWRRDTRTGPAAASPHVRRARIKQSQISLGGLFALTTIAAILFGAVVTTHDLVFVFLAVYGHWTLISMCIVVIVFDRGLPQAFCLAAITPAILSMVAATFFVPWMGSAGEIAIRIAFVVNFVVILLIGLAGVGMRVWLAAVAQPSEFRDAGQQVPQNHARETRRARSPEAD